MKVRRGSTGCGQRIDQRNKTKEERRRQRRQKERRLNEIRPKRRPNEIRQKRRPKRTPKIIQNKTERKIK